MSEDDYVNGQCQQNTFASIAAARGASPAATQMIPILAMRGHAKVTALDINLSK